MATSQCPKAPGWASNSTGTSVRSTSPTAQSLLSKPSPLSIMPEYTVVVTDHDFTDLSIERDGLSDITDVVELTNDVGADAADAQEILARADAVINLRYDLDATAIDALDDCRVISRYGIGVDNIDVEAAAERGIPV